MIDTLGLGDRLSHRPSQLSGGQQQRVACARALVSRPAIIFADEPTGNLDSRSSAEILGFLRRSVDEFGQTIVMVTHDPRAAAYADRVLFLADGRIVDELLDPTADAVLERMKGFEPAVEPADEPTDGSGVTMLRLSVKSVRGHLVRFLLTAFAVTLGVAFVAGSFVLRDSIDATLDDLITAASKGVDVSVRGTARRPVPRRRRPPSAADRPGRPAGVGRGRRPVLAGPAGTVMIVGKDGVVVRNCGAPTFGFAFRADDPAFTVRRRARTGRTG